MRPELERMHKAGEKCSKHFKRWSTQVVKDQEKLIDERAQKVIASAETLFKMVEDQIWAKNIIVLLVIYDLVCWEPSVRLSNRRCVLIALHNQRDIVNA